MKKILFGIASILFSFVCFYFTGKEYSIVLLMGISATILGFIFAVWGLFEDDK